jgi:hypothetical protein
MEDVWMDVGISDRGLNFHDFIVRVTVKRAMFPTVEVVGRMFECVGNRLLPRLLF